MAEIVVGAVKFCLEDGSFGSFPVLHLLNDHTNGKINLNILFHCLIYFRDAYLICLVDSFTSTFAGFVIFAILGVMASEANTEVDKVVEAG